MRRTLRRAMHRLRQGAGAMRTRYTPSMRDEAASLLTPELLAVFDTMMPRDREHGVLVMRRVRARAGDDATLLAAALLHDCGKGSVAVWQRVLHVLLGVAPALRVRIAREVPGWRGAMYRLLHHPELGAGMVAAAGGGEEMVRLVRGQDDLSPDRRLALLQAADDA